MSFKKTLKIDESPLWSPTRLSIAERCMKQYWFQYIFHLDYKVNSGIAIGKLIHTMMQNFRKLNPHTNELVQGYSSYEAFVNSAVRDWKFCYAEAGEVDGHKIAWGDYDGNGWGKALIGRIAETAGLVYTRYMNEEPRLETEVEMRGEIDGIKIMARADELRENLVVRDHKSGISKIGEYFVENNNQMTLCLICLFNCLNSDYSPIVSKIYSKYRGINLNEFLDIARIQIHDISPKWPKDGIHTPTTSIHEARRTERDFNELLEAIISRERALEERDFSASKENCDYCFYKQDCHNYTPRDYHQEEYEQNFPLFAHAGVFVDACNPKISQRRLQRSLRFK